MKSCRAFGERLIVRVLWEDIRVDRMTAVH
jgi:hypothetical protein